VCSIGPTFFSVDFLYFVTAVHALPNSDDRRGQQYGDTQPDKDSEDCEKKYHHH